MRARADTMIRTLMEKRDWTTAQLAQKSGFSKAAIFAWLQRRRAPTWDACRTLAYWLKCDATRLFKETRNDG